MDCILLHYIKMISLLVGAVIFAVLSVAHADLIFSSSANHSVFSVYSGSGSDSSFNSVVIIAAGTALGVDSYSNLASYVAKELDDSLFVVVDTNPGNFTKTSPSDFINAFYNIVQWVKSTLRRLAILTEIKYYVGGHSASGQAALQALSKLTEGKVVGFIGIDSCCVGSPTIFSNLPFVPKYVPPSDFTLLTVPSLYWTTSQNFPVSPSIAGKAFFDNSNPLNNGECTSLFQLKSYSNGKEGYEHCVFTNDGCPLLGGVYNSGIFGFLTRDPKVIKQKQIGVYEAVAKSIANFVNNKPQDIFNIASFNSACPTSREQQAPNSAVENLIRQMLTEDFNLDAPTDLQPESESGQEVVEQEVEAEA